MLGVSAERGARVPLAGIDFDALPSLSYLRDPGAMPPGWTGGEALDDGAVEIARLGLLLPAMVGVLLNSDDRRFDGCAQVSLCDLSQGAEQAAHAYELVARSPVPLREVGMTEFAVFRGGVAQRDQVAIIVGTPDLSAVVPVRVHSSCLTGDLFGSLKCDCGDQLRRGLRKLKELGGGVLLYLDQEAEDMAGAVGDIVVSTVGTDRGDSIAPRARRCVAVSADGPRWRRDRPRRSAVDAAYSACRSTDTAPDRAGRCVRSRH